MSHGNGGIATGGGVGWIATPCTPCANTRSDQYDVFTNGGPAAAFRAPGQPMGAFALEQLIDELAEKLGMDPLALRDKLDAGPGAPGPGGNDAATRAARKAERRLGAERFGWHQRRRPASDAGAVKRGLGMAQSMWGRFVDLDSACEVRLHKDGSIEFLSSVQDIGTGTRTAVAMVVAEELGVRPEDIDREDRRHPVPDRAVVGRLEDAVRHSTARRRARGASAGAVARSWLYNERSAQPDGVAAVARERRARARCRPRASRRRRRACPTTAATRTAATAACSSRRSPSTPRPASSRSSASSRCTTAGASINPLARAVADQRRHPPRHVATRSTSTASSTAPTGRMVNPNLEQYKIAGPARRRRSRSC